MTRKSGSSLDVWTSIILVTTFSQLSVSDNTSKYEVVKIAGGSAGCATDAPWKSVQVRSRLDCSVTCTSSTNCSYFNYKADVKICDLFLLEPQCYEEVPQCMHYEVCAQKFINVCIATNLKNFNKIFEKSK